MTIKEKRTTIENKLLGAEKLYRLLNHTHYFLCGCASLGIFPIWQVYNTRVIVTVSCICFAIISRLLGKIFRSVRDEAQKEYEDIKSLQQWSLNNN